MRIDRWRELSRCLRCLACAIALSSMTFTSAAAINVEEITTAKGVKAWLVEEHTVPQVALKFAFIGGSSQDPDGKEGLASLVTDLLTEGAGDLSGDEFKRRYLGLGSRLTATS